MTHFSLYRIQLTTIYKEKTTTTNLFNDLNLKEIYDKFSKAKRKTNNN